MGNGRDWVPEYAEKAWAVHIWDTTRRNEEHRKVSTLRRYPAESKTAGCVSAARVAAAGKASGDEELHRRNRSNGSSQTRGGAHAARNGE